MIFKEFLKLEPLRKHKVLAGASGLNKRITNINIYEYRLIENRDRSGELYITSCFSTGGDLNSVFEMVLTLIETNSPGLLIADGIMKNINSEIAKLADDNDFPIVMIPDYVMYSSIISAFFDKNIKRKNNMKEKLINQIYELEMEPGKRLEEINPNFKDNYLFVYIVSDHGYRNFVYESFGFLLRTYLNSEAVMFRDGTLLIITNETGIFDYNKIAHNIKKAIEDNGNKISFNYDIGFSLICSDVKNTKKSIKEAMYAQVYQSNISKKMYSTFDDIGRYRILIPMIENEEVIEYVESIVHIVNEYDRVNNDTLYNTFLEYRDCNYNINKTAENLFVHSNTVRYRMKKMESILENRIDSIQEFTLFSDLLELKNIIDQL